MPASKRALTRGDEGAQSSTKTLVRESFSAPLTTFEVVTGFEDLLDKATMISSLLKATKAPAAARWLPLMVWMRHNPKVTPWSVLVYRDRRLVAAALLVRSSRRGILRFETIGDGQLPCWLPWSDASSATALASALGESLRAIPTPWILHVRHLQTGDPVVGALKGEFAVSRTEQGVSPRLDFRPGEPLSTYISRNTRSALAKARNRINNAGLDIEMIWTTSTEDIDATVPAIVARQVHGTGLRGFLPVSWDHLFCQLWDHPARRAELFWIGSLTACVMTNDAEVGDGFQGGRCG